MTRSVGKQFEDNFKNSVPKYMLSHRPPDSAQGFDVGSTNKLRFNNRSSSKRTCRLAPSIKQKKDAILRVLYQLNSWIDIQQVFQIPKRKN